MKIALYWSESTNRIFYKRYGCIYTIDGNKSKLKEYALWFNISIGIIHEIGEI